MARIPVYKLSDFIATSIQDSIDRLYISKGQDSVLIGGSFLATNRGRISDLTMTGSALTTIELYINDVPQFVSGNPSVDGRTYDNPSFQTYNRGDFIEVLATAGPSVGNVALGTETREIIKRTEVVPASARQRLRRDVQRVGYLSKPSVQSILVSTYASLDEATSGIAPANQMTDTGDKTAGVRNKVGTGNDPDPKPRPGPRLH